MRDSTATGAKTESLQSDFSHGLQVFYDPSKFRIIGGGGRGGDVIVISNEAEKRLYDKSLPPALMGGLVGVPHSGMQATAWGIEYLGWNAKWVLGYAGTNELKLALERGEIDMTGTGNLFDIRELLASGKFKVLTQSGIMKDGKFGTRPEFASTPTLPGLVQGKITDPAAREAFRYYNDILAIDKWVALPPETSDAVLESYRTAFSEAVVDPDFLSKIGVVSDEFRAMPYNEVEQLIQELAMTSDSGIFYIDGLMKKQGLTEN